MRIAALDLGSNSFHLLVADVQPDGSFVAVTREKEMLRLGDEVARHGRIPPAAADRAVAAVGRQRQIAQGVGAVEIIAKATSAIRTASNGSEVVDRIEAETGVEVDVISGLQEAALVFAAVRASIVIDPGPALCLDIGGGSVELAIGDAAGLRWAASLALGVGRLTAELGIQDPPSKTDRARIEDRVRPELEELGPAVKARSPKMLVGTSGTLNDLARMAIALADPDVELPPSTNGLRVAKDDLAALHHKLLRATTDERRRFAGLEEPRRSELLPVGSTLLMTVLDAYGLDELTVSDWSLREGIVLDAVRTHDPDDWSDEPWALRHAAVMGLARRCNSDAAHTARVAQLALELFDKTMPLHGLDARDREMLEYAALLHDIGQHVSRKGHQRHAAYLVENAQLRGFEPGEIAFLAALVRHHRRGEPKQSEPRYAALDRESRERMVKLAALLRVADGLDRGRSGAVTGLHVTMGADLVVVRVDADGDAELELWGARRRRDLFESVFGRELELLVARAAHIDTA
ncbi:MAG TPA: Ppx/GppA phosphatase family protein [Acidimicrobiia bacterium]|nr:Ppx/GppA phosphatase family protein [Acidimicrobiia bacterium]